METVPTGIVYIDVGWHRRIYEKDGLPLTDEAEVIATWDVDDGSNPLGQVLKPSSKELMTLLSGEGACCNRPRSTRIHSVYSAGERPAARELPEFGGTDLNPYRAWPPLGSRLASALADRIGRDFQWSVPGSNR
jgi:hypothetical protein